MADEKTKSDATDNPVDAGVAGAVGAPGSAAGASRQGPEVRWDDSEMVSTYANVCNVQGTREELALLFGSNQSLMQDANQPVNIKLSNRILLTPAAAKRFALLLQMGLEQYEKKYGEIKLG